jgi:hypothetical protein
MAIVATGIILERRMQLALREVEGHNTPEGCVRGSTMRQMLSAMISALILSPLRLSRPTLTGSLNRRGPALPGLK